MEKENKKEIVRERDTHTNTCKGRERYADTLTYRQAEMAGENVEKEVRKKLNYIEKMAKMFLMTMRNTLKCVVRKHLLLLHCLRGDRLHPPYRESRTNEDK